MAIRGRFNLVFMVVMVGFIGFFSACTAQLESNSEQDVRPMTGTIVKDTLRDGLGELTIINDNSKMDAFAVLTDSQKEPIIKVFIRAGESFKISGIEDGSYDMYFRLGNRWRQDGSRFDKDEVRYKLDRALPFETVSMMDGISYSTWTVALQEAVPNANEAMSKIPVSEEEFPG
jgi:hypothetical protein